MPHPPKRKKTRELSFFEGIKAKCERDLQAVLITFCKFRILKLHNTIIS